MLKAEDVVTIDVTKDNFTLTIEMAKTCIADCVNNDKDIDTEKLAVH